MNERIKELAEHAKTYANQCTRDIDGDISWHWMDYYTEKFAELIIRECIGVVENLSPGYKDYRDQIEDAFRRDCVEEMKHKFGVKE
jgi:hypothetical protein